MRADAAMTSPSSLRFKVDGPDCQNEVRALRAAVGSLVVGDDKLSFDTQAGVMKVLSGMHGRSLRLLNSDHRRPEVGPSGGARAAAHARPQTLSARAASAH